MRAAVYDRAALSNLKARALSHDELHREHDGRR